MTDIQPENYVPASKDKIKSRVTFLAIIGVFVLPFVILPLIMSPAKMNKTNKGVLLEPHVVFAGVQAAEIKNLSAIKNKWILLYFVPDKCAQTCINALYSMRQVPKTLAHDADRVQSLLVRTVEMNAEFDSLVEKEFTVMSQARADKNNIDIAFAQALPGIDVSQAGYIYLMSPDGYVFMYYPSYKDEQEAINHALDIRSDLKKTIKGSRI